MYHSSKGTRQRLIRTTGINSKTGKYKFFCFETGSYKAFLVERMEIITADGELIGTIT
jgi:hypothetical protein